MWSMVEDLLEGSVEKIRVRDERDDKKLFLGLVVYVSDYPPLPTILLSWAITG